MSGKVKSSSFKVESQQKMSKLDISGNIYILFRNRVVNVNEPRIRGKGVGMVGWKR